MALTIFFCCDLCGLPFGVFLAFYDERLQAGLGLALFLCSFFLEAKAYPHRLAPAGLCLRLSAAASRPCCGLWYVLCRSSGRRWIFWPCRFLFYLHLEVYLDARRPP